MSSHDLDEVQAPPEATLRQVIEVVDRSAMAVALLVDEHGVLAGILTDGDVRRALLNGAQLSDRALPFATRQPQTVSAGSSRALVLDLMRALRISAVPEVDESGRLVGVHTLSDVVGQQPLENTAVIMAGGRGTRLGRATQNRPKPLMEVAGRSILEWIILNLVGGGIRDICVSVNHLSDQIETHLEAGRHLGCEITYLREDPDKPLGTAGSLALLRRQGRTLQSPVLVMNGDLMVQFEPAHLLRFHDQVAADLTVATRPYQHMVPFGVVKRDRSGHGVSSIEEKPTFSADINAGVYALSPVVLDMLEPGDPITMPELINRCLSTGRNVSAWHLPSDWIDVGTPSDLARAKGQI